MTKLEQKNFSRPDEVRTFEKGKVELVNIGGKTREPKARMAERRLPQAGPTGAQHVESRAIRRLSATKCSGIRSRSQ